MSPLVRLWKFLTPTKALDVSSGRYEIQFYESLYRLSYLAGFSTYGEGFLYFIYSYTVKTAMALFLCGELWYLFSQSSNLDVIIENINVTLIHVIAIYRYRVMMNHSETFRKLTAAMESKAFDVSTPHRKRLVEFWYLRSELYFKLLLGLAMGTLATWYVYPLVDDLEYNLTVAIKIPFDYRNPVMYPIMFIVVVIPFHYISFFVIVNDLIMQVTLMQILCQYSVLADCFENIIEDCNGGIEGDDQFQKVAWRDKYINRLGLLVDQHKTIINNTIELRNVLSTPMLFQFAASAMLLCFAGYQVTVAIKASPMRFLMSIQYLGYNMFELFIFCRWCDEIRAQSENIRNAVYSSGWERGPSSIPGVRHRLMLVMARASKPMVMSAGGLYGLSLESYTTVVKTSYTAFTVLLRLR